MPISPMQSRPRDKASKNVKINNIFKVKICLNHNCFLFLNFNFFGECARRGRLVLLMYSNVNNSDTKACMRIRNQPKILDFLLI
jgi:hypothetical protein